VQVQDVTMFVPQPEFDFLAERAAASSSFVVQLTGECAQGVAPVACACLQSQGNTGAREKVARSTAARVHGTAFAVQSACGEAQASVCPCMRWSAVEFQSRMTAAAPRAGLQGTHVLKLTTRACVC
jgi:hypothetical protein